MNVGKTVLLEKLSMLFATGDLSFASVLTLRDDILAELETFELTASASGSKIIT